MTADPDHDGLRIFNRYYGTDMIDTDETQDYLKDDMAQNGLSPLKTYLRHAIWSKASPDGPDDPRNAYQFSINEKDGVIISHWSNRNDDSQKRLPWSELIYQAVSRDYGNISLRWIILHNILNPGTNDLIREIARTNHADERQETTWRTWTVTDPYFISLLGTDAVQQVVWMLNDHSVALGRLTITEILTHGQWLDEGRDSDIWVKLAPYDPATAASTSSGTRT